MRAECRTTKALGEPDAGNPQVRFDEGALETGLRSGLNGHEAGNGGHSQDLAYGIPRQRPTPRTDRDSSSSERWNVLSRVINRSSLAWDRRRGVTCVLKVIRQIVHAPAGDERRICGPYRNGNAMWRRQRSSGQFNWVARGNGMAEPPAERRRQQPVRMSRCAAPVIPGVDSDSTQRR